MAWMDSMNTEDLTGYIGLAQLSAGSFMNPKRPNYAPPGAANEALGLARMMAYSSTMPGYEQAMNNIYNSENRSLNRINRNLTSASQVMATAGQIDSNTKSSINQLNAANSQFKFNAFQNLQRTLQNYAQYQDKAWQWNKQQKYLDAVGSKNALTGSGLQNINNWNNYKLQSDAWEKYLSDGSKPVNYGMPQ